MKKNYLYLLFVLIAGCKKDFLDVNTNPNSPPFATIGLLLPNALKVTDSNQVLAYTFICGWMQQWAISVSYAPNGSDFTTYRETTDFGNSVWQNIYNNLEDYDYVETNATTANKPFYIAAAKIMKTFNFQQLIDMFGDIPYSGAFQGTRNLRPVYQDAQTIYDSLIIELNKAINLMSSSNAIEDDGGDVLFKGKTTSWIQFANSLKLRILMRQSAMPGRNGYIKDEIHKIMLNQKGFLTEDAGVNPGYSNDASKQNNLYAYFYNTRGTYTMGYWVANQNSIDFYKDNDDPRLPYFFTKSLLQEYTGNVLGLSTYTRDSSSKFGPGVLKTASQPGILMLLAESYFLQAEAAQKNFMNGDAQDLYESGVIASFVFLGSTEQAAKSYLKSSDPDVNWSKAPDKIKLIITQKWAAENTITPFEEWCDYRRTGFPQIPLTKSPFVDVKAIPVRILYPSSEYQTNAANIPDQSPNAHHTDKLFWMP